MGVGGAAAVIGNGAAGVKGAGAGGCGAPKSGDCPKSGEGAGAVGAATSSWRWEGYPI